MKVSSSLGLFLFFAGIAQIGSTMPAAFAQQTGAQGASAGSTVGELSAAFSGGKTIQNVQLSGDAVWYAGSLEDSGTVTLTASPDGSWQMQLLLGASGQRTETQTGAGSSANCLWAGSDRVTHQVDLGNCWRPALWFLPAFSLQPSLVTNSFGIADLGMGTVGASKTEYRHLQGQLNPSSLPNSQGTSIEQQGTADLGLDPVTLLPAVLAYSIRPDNGAQVAIAIEVHYSDYHAINGVQIPFLIQRYVNGSLQLEIRVYSAQIN
jgi:hypothetical protein